MKRLEQAPGLWCIEWSSAETRNEEETGLEVRIVNSLLLLLNLRCFPGSNCLEQQFFYIGQNPEVDFRPLILSVSLSPGLILPLSIT